MTSAITQFNSFYQYVTPIEPSALQENANFETQSFFAEVLWKKISPSTKKYLCENNFVFPMNLTEGYSYYNVDGPNYYAYVKNNPLHYSDPDGRAVVAAFYFLFEFLL